MPIILRTSWPLVQVYLIFFSNVREGEVTTRRERISEKVIRELNWTKLVGMFSLYLYSLLKQTQRILRDFWRHFEDHRLPLFHNTIKNRTFVNTLKTTVYHDFFLFL